MVYTLTYCPPIADYVFFENSSSNPYLIRRIEELNKVFRCFTPIFFFHVCPSVPEGECLGFLLIDTLHLHFAC